MAQEDRSVKKIVVHSGDDIASLAENIGNSKERFLLIAFTEANDILVSPVNMKFLLNIADESKKVLIAQILDYKFGVKNAEKVDMPVITGAEMPEQEVWDEALESHQSRLKERESRLRKSSKQAGEGLVKATVVAEALTPEINPEVVAPEAINESEIESTAEVIEPVAGGSMGDKLGHEFDENIVAPDTINDAPLDEIEVEISDTEIPEAEVIEESPFSQQIKSVLEKSKVVAQSQKTRVVEQSGVMLALDHDIETDAVGRAEKKREKEVAAEASQIMATSAAIEAEAQSSFANIPAARLPRKIAPNERTLIGKDLMSNKELLNSDLDDEMTGGRPGFTPQNRERISPSKEVSPLENRRSFANRAAIGGGLLNSIKNFKPKEAMAAVGRINFKAFFAKKSTLYILLPALLVTAIIAFLIYRFAPLVRVQMAIEAKEIAIEESFSSTTEITEFNLEQRKVPMKLENVTKSVSGNKDTTGTAVRGEKAGGVISIKCFLDKVDGISIGSGSTITSSQGLKFEVLTDIFINTCPSTATNITVRAVEPGPEYNIISGNIFTLPGFNSDEVFAENLTSFKGGTKEEFRVVAQADVDAIVEDLKKEALNLAKSELEDKSQGDWVIVSQSIKQELDGTPVLDVPVGSEASIVNVSITVESTATFYNQAGVKASADELLKDFVDANSLFDSNIETIIEQPKAEVILSEYTENSGVIILKATAKVKPNVDKDLIKTDLVNKDWEAGVKYLNDLKYTSGDPKVTFSPAWFPSWLKYFPKNDQNIIVEVAEK